MCTNNIYYLPLNLQILKFFESHYDDKFKQACVNTMKKE
jgi:hypothetical protein